MFSSEQKFSINGSDKRSLLAALNFGFGLANSKLAGYLVKDGQFIIYWGAPTSSEINVLPEFSSNDTLGSLVWDFIQNSKAERVFRQTTNPADIDGSVELGWQINVPTYETHESNYALLVISHDWIYYHK